MSATSEIKKIESRIIFGDKLKAIRLLFTKEILSNSILNSFKADMMDFTKAYETNPTFYEAVYKQGLEFVMELSKLVSESSSLNMKNQYLQINRYLDYIKADFYNKPIKQNTILAKLIDQALESFDLKEKFKTDLDAFGYIQDNSLF